jgi:hypothetical protein
MDESNFAVHSALPSVESFERLGFSFTRFNASEELKASGAAHAVDTLLSVKLPAGWRLDDNTYMPMSSVWPNERHAASVYDADGKPRACLLTWHGYSSVGEHRATRVSLELSKSSQL